MAKNNKMPAIRFSGYTNAWEQRKLGDIATFSKGNGYSKSDLAPSGNPIILYGRLYTNYETTIKNVDTFVELKDKSVISQGGEVIVPASGETVEDISRASVVKNQGIIIGGDLNVIRVNGLLNPTFLALTISNGEQQKELSKRAQGKSVVHLHNSDLQEVNLTFPLFNEQRAISTLFEKMDNTITLYQRKLEKLKLTKKALLQKLFPKNGSKLPELRFKGFTDAWEQRKLESLGKIITGNTPSTLKKEYWSTNSEGVVWITPTDINSVKTDWSERLLTEEGASQARIVPANSILVTCIASIGKNTINTVEAAFNQQINALVPHLSNSYFILTMLNNMESAFKRVAGTSATSIINKKEFGQLSALLPRVEEQNKIGEIFELIDKSITLHHRKLEMLKNIKKGLLQKMFV